MVALTPMYARTSSNHVVFALERVWPHAPREATVVPFPVRDRVPERQQPPRHADFDRHGTSYREEVAESVAFIGQGLDFFSEVKARYLLETAARHFGRLDHLSVLDVGCGLGLIHKLIESSFGSLDGIDTSEEMVQNAARLNRGVSYRSYEGDRLPYRDRSFDLLFAINVLHHVPVFSRSHLLREMARVTRNDGLVVIFEHNPLNPLTRLAVSRCAFDQDCRLLRRDVTVRLFAENGFVPTISRHIIFFPWRGQHFASLDRLLGAAPFGAQYLAAARPAH
jgi:SAM-dependent methyltransferase